ncbi:MAG: hypothetical protein O7C56_03935 [Rickettsia endosymbiont of Ixodes persulcatus]|nr:hypothetical protein [Rickettsia endosymbiont of Ixodes persulcatus]
MPVSTLLPLFNKLDNVGEVDCPFVMVIIFKEKKKGKKKGKYKRKKRKEKKREKKSK